MLGKNVNSPLDTHMVILVICIFNTYSMTKYGKQLANYVTCIYETYTVYVIHIQYHNMVYNLSAIYVVYMSTISMTVQSLSFLPNIFDISYIYSRYTSKFEPAQIF